MTEDTFDPKAVANARPVAPESLAGDASLWNPPTPPRTPREALEAAISAAIDLLDSAEMLDFDLEDGGDTEPDADEEPSLGAPEHHPSQPAVYRYAARVSRGPEDDQSDWAAGDRAVDGDDREESGDEHEPSLGSIGSCGSVYASQTSWATGLDNDAEEEHSGAEPDEDASDATLGATHALNQEIAWAAGGAVLWGSHPTCEEELSFGWSEGRGHPEPVPFGGNYDGEEQHDGCEPEDHIADHDGLSIELSEGGSPTPCLDQRVEIGGAAHELACEQAAMHAAATRLSEVVVRIRAAGEAEPEPLPGVVDIIGPASLSGEMATITAVL
jgi:hypothetical protein